MKLKGCYLELRHQPWLAETRTREDVPVVTSRPRGTDNSGENEQRAGAGLLGRARAQVSWARVLMSDHCHRGCGNRLVPAQGPRFLPSESAIARRLRHKGAGWRRSPATPDDTILRQWIRAAANNSERPGQRAWERRSGERQQDAGRNAGTRKAVHARLCRIDTPAGRIGRLAEESQHGRRQTAGHQSQTAWPAARAVATCAR